jgi:hypothetical protein
LLTTTAGRFRGGLIREWERDQYDGVELKAHRSVVARIAPDPGEGRRAHSCGVAGERSFVLAQTDAVHEILDLGDPLGRERLNFLDPDVGTHGSPRSTTSP